MKECLKGENFTLLLDASNFNIPKVVYMHMLKFNKIDK